MRQRGRILGTASKPSATSPSQGLYHGIEGYTKIKSSSKRILEKDNLARCLSDHDRVDFWVMHAAFGNNPPGNFLTGFAFTKAYWLIDIAKHWDGNMCIVVHLVGAYQVKPVNHN
ncbi:hypothetical protein V6N13_114938 [Hibiscus sabdariffa]